MRRHVGWLVPACLLAAGLWATPVRAAAPGLQVAPLQYDDALAPGQVKNGFVDVANPGDSTIEVVSSVRGFKQTGQAGDLTFFDDADLARAITVGLDRFTIGPREAVRVTFSVNAAKLPEGGTYAAIFFRTQPTDQTSSSSYVAQSANLGTLLLLTVGSNGANSGTATPRLPFWQFGSGLTGRLDYRNTNQGAHAVGFKPRLQVRVLPWGQARLLDTGLVLPGVTRQFSVVRAGSYFGLLPILVTDLDTHRTVVTWVLACTGWYGLGVIGLGLLLTVYVVWRLVRRKPLWPFRKAKKAKVKRPLDGLGPKA